MSERKNSDLQRKFTLATPVVPPVLSTGTVQGKILRHQGADVHDIESVIHIVVHIVG